MSFILVLSTLNYSLNIPAHGQSSVSQISQEEYDKIKNCTTNLSKKPTPVEYLTHFDCGHVSKDESGKTVRQFTLIVEENQKIPIAYEGHIFEGWTFNGTIPGPTIRVTEGDLVRTRVINSNENTHAHSLYSQPTHYVKNNAFMKAGQPGGTISPGRSFTYDFVAGAYGIYPYYCHVEPIADHINRGIMEFTYDYPGSYMFHAHQILFTDPGWMGLFDVRGLQLVLHPVTRPKKNYR